MQTDNFPALAMANWLEAKRLAHKVRSFSERRARQAVDQAQFEAALRVRPGDNVPSQPGAEVVIHGAVAGQLEDGRAPSATALFSVTAFLQALSRSAADGHIVIRATGEGGTWRQFRINGRMESRPCSVLLEERGLKRGGGLDRRNLTPALRSRVFGPIPSLPLFPSSFARFPRCYCCCHRNRLHDQVPAAQPNGGVWRRAGGDPVGGICRRNPR